MRRLPVTCLLLIALALAASPLSLTAGEADDGREFLETVQKHIQAIQNRDLDALLSTVTAGEKLTLIFPDGTTQYTRQEYVDFHTAWFADDGWSMQLELLSHQVRGNHGVALTRTIYTDAAGTRQAMLSLHFVCEAGQWRLVFDQNTRIAVTE